MRRLFLILILVGCSHDFPAKGPVYIDPRIPAEIQEKILDGYEDWCDATRGQECPELTIGRGDYEWVYGTRDHGNAGTQDSAFGAKVYVDFRAIPRRYWLASIKHEIGHTVGLPHAEYGLMLGDQRLWQRVEPGCIDQRTLADYCEARGCAPALPPIPECEE